MAAIARRGNGNAYYYATTYNWPAEASEFLKSVPHEPGRDSTIGRCLLEGKTVQIPDVLADAEYSMLETQQKAGYRTNPWRPPLAGRESDRRDRPDAYAGKPLHGQADRASYNIRGPSGDRY